MQVAARNKRLFLQVGARSDVLRGADCNRYTFHVDIPVTVMVNAAGQALAREGYIKGKRIFFLTSDYLFGHDLAKAAKAFVAANGGTVVGDELTATDTTDFSPFLLKIRQAKPDLVATNLGGNQVTNFVKQYSEFGLPYQVAGFNLNTADAWSAGEGNLAGIWPTVWHHDLDIPGSKAFVAKFRQKHGQPPENHAWIEYVSLKIMAQAINATKGTDTEKLIAYFESQAEFDLLKSRKGYFRSWDHQLIQEAYPFTVKPKGQAKDKWDFLKFGDAVPAANLPLESINPPKSANACVL
jgi:branched-chain amino acid transport system substrate-binding protein